MTDIQNAVNAIHEAMKTEWALVIWYRSPKGREIKREYDEATVLDCIRNRYEPGAIPIASLLKPVHVGTTPLPGEDEGNEWKGGIGS